MESPSNSELLENIACMLAWESFKINGEWRTPLNYKLNYLRIAVDIP